MNEALKRRSFRYYRKHGGILSNVGEVGGIFPVRKAE